MKSKASIRATKNFGRVYTPQYLVELILDFVGYQSGILHKHLIDNSCGNGAFLIVAVNRYCKEFLSQSSDIEALKQDLETYFHGIEIDQNACNECKINLSRIAKQYTITGVEWDVICDDALKNKQFIEKMDYVVGNPPYVRVHNLDETYNSVKEYTFSQGGMTDLFIVFFQIGFQMLSETGKMCIITPSSWLSSGAGKTLRKYILQCHNWSGAIDLELLLSAKTPMRIKILPEAH